MTHDDPLFDPNASGNDELEPQEFSPEELAGMEQALSPYRYQPREYAFDAPSTSTRRPGGPLPWRLVLPLAAAATLVLSLIWWTDDDVPAARYTVATVVGTPSVGGRPLVRGQVLEPGQLVSTGADSRVSVRIAGGDPSVNKKSVLLGGGLVDLGPESSLRLMPRTGPDDDAAWRLQLERGELTASIFAAPRLFQLGTPSGLAIDMGCFYTAVVDEQGVTTLSVRGGLVIFSSGGRQAWVPEGASLRSVPGQRLSTPVWTDAGAELQEVFAALDDWAAQPEPAVLDDDQGSLLKRLFKPARQVDTLMLWHQLDHPWRVVRESAFDSLAKLVEPPDVVRRDELLAGDERQRNEWRSRLEYHWR
jgi:hypothetical protein